MPATAEDASWLAPGDHVEVESDMIRVEERARNLTIAALTQGARKARIEAELKTATTFELSDPISQNAEALKRFEDAEQATLDADRKAVRSGLPSEIAWAGPRDLARSYAETKQGCGGAPTRPCFAATLAAAGPVAAAPPVPPDVTQAGPQDVACPAGAIRVAPGRPIQDAVDRAPPGATFCIGAGRHRGQTIAPKDGQRFVGEPGALLDGTVDVTGFTREGPYWVAPAPGPRMEPYGECLGMAPACSRPEVVMLDEASLKRVLDDASVWPGTFTIDGSHRIRIADDPQGRRVAASAAAYAFLPNGAKDVTVANLTIERYGNPAQHGAIYADHDPRATGWIVEHNDVRLNSGLGILAGPGSRVRANRVENNGQLGISAASRDQAIVGNVVAGNGTRGFNPEWEAGGVKTAVDVGLVVRGNHIHGNHGPGLWCDIDCRDVVYEGNLVEGNDGPGIFYEISHSGIIRGNIARGNGVTSRQWVWRANIVLAASEDVAVENNLVVVQNGGTGIALIDQGRRRESGGLYRTAGNRVSGNEVRFMGAGHMGGLTDVAVGSPNDGVIETGGNRFDANRYVWAPGSRVDFTWGRSVTGFEGFQALGQDRGSTGAVAGDD